MSKQYEVEAFIHECRKEGSSFSPLAFIKDLGLQGWRIIDMRESDYYATSDKESWTYRFVVIADREMEEPDLIVN